MTGIVRALISTAATISLLSGCATTSKLFYHSPQAANATSLCRAVLTTNDEYYRQDAVTELQRRGLTEDDCRQKVASENLAIGTVALIAGATAIGIACANHGCPSGGERPYGVARYGAGADWDQFRNEQGQLVWACRDISTGKFTYVNNCHGIQTDYRWPGQ